MKKKHLKDMGEIMSVDTEMIKLLPKLEYELNLMNPWVKQLPIIFCNLELKDGQTILVIPCGKGGVSIPLAKKYNVKVIGCDILQEYIEQARQIAKKYNVSSLCKFEVEDIRQVVKRKNICDLLIWVAPPHLWKNSKKTIKELRNSVRDKGVILIADAYLYSKEYIGDYPNYELLSDTTKGYTFYGDGLIRLEDYKSKLWREDYQRTKESAQKLLRNTSNKDEQIIIRKYLKSLGADEKKDTKCLGLAIWLIKVNKK